MDPCKPEVRPGAREESSYPAWLAAPAMTARDTTKVYISRLDTGCGLKTSTKVVKVHRVAAENGVSERRDFGVKMRSM